jgi:hypothetical protein
VSLLANSTGTSVNYLESPLIVLEGRKVTANGNIAWLQGEANTSRFDRTASEIDGSLLG